MAESAEDLLIDFLYECYADPLRFVMGAFPWSTDSSLQLVKLLPPFRERFNCDFGPDIWSCEFLDELGALVKERGFDGTHSVNAIRMAVASGHGIGKSALTAWIVNWIMSTRPNAKGVVTANTSEQLSGRTWAEIVKWGRKSITAHWFDFATGKGSMKMRHKTHPESWVCAAFTCREENSEAFAGLHAADSTPFYLFDEASAIPQSICEVAEGGLTDGEPMFFKFGNPTRNSGDFYDCFNGEISKRWSLRQVDSRTVQLPNKKLHDQWIEDYGFDSDFVKVRVRGLFPSMSIKQFISTADVDAAYGLVLRSEQFDFAPKILSCDPAWEGDDELVIGLRQGLHFEILHVVPKNDNDIEIAGILAREEDHHQVDAVFIDAGFGTGIASAGKTLRRNWTLVWFSGQSSDAGCLNKRAEMWKLMRDWLKQGGALPLDVQLRRDLIAPETVPRLDGKIQLESKADMKKRKLKSPNKADCLALTFAFPVSKRLPSNQSGRTGSSGAYNPFKHRFGGS